MRYVPSVSYTHLDVYKRQEKILFPILCTIVISLILPSCVPLIGMLMLGNLMKESGVVDRINKTAGNELMNIITIFLGISVGCTTNADTFFNLDTLKIIALGLAALDVYKRQPEGSHLLQNAAAQRLCTVW